LLIAVLPCLVGITGAIGGGGDVSPGKVVGAAVLDIPCCKDIPELVRSNLSKHLKKKCRCEKISIENICAITFGLRNLTAVNIKHSCKMCYQKTRYMCFYFAGCQFYEVLSEGLECAC